MKPLLRVVAVLLFVASFIWWTSAGYNKGWTKNTVRVWKYDEITEISYPETVDRFVPGVDFLAAGTGLAVVIFGVSFFVAKRKLR